MNFLDHVVSLTVYSDIIFLSGVPVLGEEVIMQDCLQVNCRYISQNNKSLAEKLTQVKEISKNIAFDTNFAGEYNLVIEGLPVHSLTGAVNEAKDIANSVAHNDYGTLHVIYGIGLGYLADEFVNNLKGKVIVYEPDLQVLAFVLSAVDMSQNFKTGRLFFASTEEELKKILYEQYRYKSNATFSYLDYYKSHGQDFAQIAAWLKREIVLIEHNYDFQVNNTRGFFASTIKRLAQKYKLKRLCEYKDALKDVPAIVASAGPSLSKNTELLKKYGGSAVIFSVGTALGTLYKNGITPDFVSVIEKINTSHHYNLPFSKDISFICEQFSEPSYLDIPFREKFITSSLENDDARWFLEKAEAPFAEFETKGTVAYHALYCAYYLGCNPIILIGQDLAYSDGECYSKGSKFEDLQCVFDEATQKYKITPKDFDKFKNAYCASVNWDEEKQRTAVEKRLEKLNANLVTVEGQDGNLLPTDAVYSLFIDYLQDFAGRHKNERILINSSTGGAKISGFETLPLDKAVDKYLTQKVDKDSALEKFYAIKDVKGFDIEKVKKNIAGDISVMKKLLEIILPARNEFKRVLTADASTPRDERAIKKCVEKYSGVYADIVNNYMHKYRIIKMLTAKEYSAIAYILRENPRTKDFDVIYKLACAYCDYFRYAAARLNVTIESLEDTLKELENNK